MTITSYQAKMSPSQLTVDPRVQRTEGVNGRRVKEIADNFNPCALGTITVWHKSDGTYAVIDGAHRMAAARQIGYGGEVPVTVHTGITVEQAAELFLLINEFESPSAVSRFHARVIMRDKEAIAISEVAASHGWTITRSKRPGCIAAVDALTRVYRDGGGTVPAGENRDLLDTVLGVITAAWEHAYVSQSHLLGVAQLYGRFGAGIDTKKLVTEMSHTRPDVLLGRAKFFRDSQGGTVSAAMAKILGGMHNKGRRTNLLPEWVWIR